MENLAEGYFPSPSPKYKSKMIKYFLLFSFSLPDIQTFAKEREGERDWNKVQGIAINCSNIRIPFGPQTIVVIIERKINPHENPELGMFSMLYSIIITTIHLKYRGSK